MILLDSNVLIYHSNPEIGDSILRQLTDKSLATCNVVAELLGFK
jgi:predicted nucleic acid-binding protein